MRRLHADMTLVRRLAPALFLILFTGCAPLMQNLGLGEDAKKYREAEAFFEQGNYKEARAAYLAAAEVSTESHWAERAKYRAAYILVYHENPHKDYTQAEREFGEFLNRFPKNERAGEAGSWMEVLKNFDASKTGELLKEIGSLTKKAEETAKQLQETQADKEAAARERDALSAEKSSLVKKIDDALRDKDALLKEKAALMKDKETLSREKGEMEKRVDALTKDKDKLTQAKAKLEKSLHDLMMVDVKMEKKRRKLK